MVPSVPEHAQWVPETASGALGFDGFRMVPNPLHSPKLEGSSIFPVNISEVAAFKWPQSSQSPFGFAAYCGPKIFHP